MKRFKIYLSIFSGILFLIGIFVSLKALLAFIGGDNNEVYLYTFPISVIAGLFIIFMFILVIFKTVQLQSFNNSHWVWLFNYTIIALLLVALFYVFLFRNHFSFWSLHTY